MRHVNIANDIISLGEFKAQISKYFKNIKETGRPMVITQNGVNLKPHPKTGRIVTEIVHDLIREITVKKNIV